MTVFQQESGKDGVNFEVNYCVVSYLFSAVSLKTNQTFCNTKFQLIYFRFHVKHTGFEKIFQLDFFLSIQKSVKSTAFSIVS